MPRGRKRASLRFAVTDHYGDDEIRIIERCPIRMRDASTRVRHLHESNRASRVCSASRFLRERKLPEEFQHAGCVSALVRINLGVIAFEIAIGKCGWRTVTRTRNVNDIQVVLPDETVQMDPKERLPGIRPQ